MENAGSLTFGLPGRKQHDAPSSLSEYFAWGASSDPLVICDVPTVERDIEIRTNTGTSRCPQDRRPQYFSVTYHSEPFANEPTDLPPEMNIPIHCRTKTEP